ncbi:hypothetical protein GGTG_05617 [Gaeumannomyces tritici R3-111a-1]|uniref:Uncharacterized protein n=1 Tax=Gaeumannomyces tritici (strain R3-111a-1) TaxID=644352 RepID=J3NWF3_GAET3|nr:hypothetical protein GGTG_05617 [Gaeumannomyces tritici R3-111a-1]EJT75685.1 hypothetical protein GGTG_05617 [Gaeumannomyces tritici R3-111a-1]
MRSPARRHKAPPADFFSPMHAPFAVVDRLLVENPSQVWLVPLKAVNHIIKPLLVIPTHANGFSSNVSGTRDVMLSSGRPPQQNDAHDVASIRFQPKSRLAELAELVFLFALRPVAAKLR